VKADEQGPRAPNGFHGRSNDRNGRGRIIANLANLRWEGGRAGGREGGRDEERGSVVGTPNSVKELEIEEEELGREEGKEEGEERQG